MIWYVSSMFVCSVYVNVEGPVWYVCVVWSVCECGEWYMSEICAPWIVCTVCGMHAVSLCQVCALCSLCLW